MTQNLKEEKKKKKTKKKNYIKIINFIKKKKKKTKPITRLSLQVFQLEGEKKHKFAFIKLKNTRKPRWAKTTYFSLYYY